MFTFVHEPQAPNNAFEFETIIYKHIGVLRFNFIHSDHPDPEKRFEDGKPWPIGKLEIDYDDALLLKEKLDEAIKTLESIPKSKRKYWIRHNGVGESE